MKIYQEKKWPWEYFGDQNLSGSEHVKQCKTEMVSALYALKSRKRMCENTPKLLYYIV